MCVCVICLVVVSDSVYYSTSNTYILISVLAVLLPVTVEGVMIVVLIPVNYLGFGFFCLYCQIDR